MSNSGSPHSHGLGARSQDDASEYLSAAAPATPTLHFSPLLERKNAISFTTQSNIRIGGSSRPGPVRSLDSTFSYDSYATGITSPATSFDEDGRFPGSPDDQIASTSLTGKGKGKATQINEVLSPRPFSADAGPTATLPSPFLTEPSVTSFHDVLGHYSPDVADLMPPFELESRAFDWGEFERSLCSSPGAGTSLVSPVSPTGYITTGLGLTLSSLIASPSELTNEQWPQTDTHAPNSGSEVASSQAHDAPATVQPSVVSPVAEPAPTEIASARVRRHAVSMYETFNPDSTGRSVSYRTSVITHDASHIRARANSNATSVMSRPYSTGPSPRLKKRSLTLPSWLSKAKEGKGSPVAAGLTEITGSAVSALSSGRDTTTLTTRSRPRKLYKEKGRSQTIPPLFPFVVIPDAIIQSPVTKTEPTIEVVDATVKPVEEVSLFELMLPRETKLFVLEQLVIVHQEEFERRLKEGKWSVAHASRERWVAKDAGMRELVKLSRVSIFHHFTFSDANTSKGIQVVAEFSSRRPTLAIL